MTNLKNFVGETIIQLVNAGVNIHLEYVENVSSNKNDPDPCEAYFSENPFTIKVATKYPFEIWAKDFIHEYCHYQQNIEKLLVVKKFNNVRDGWDANSIINAWINGKNTNIKLLKKCIDAVRSLELDCEKKVVDLIHTHNLEINISEYFKNANSYVLFYNVMLEKRKWYNISPVFIRDIINLMPSSFLYDYSDNYCRKHYKWYGEYCHLVKTNCFK